MFILQRQNEKQIIKIIMILGLIICIDNCILSKDSLLVVGAKDMRTEITGKIFELDDKSNYEFSESDAYKLTDKQNLTCGKLEMAGNILDITQKNDIPAYLMDDETESISFFYTYDDSLLTANEEEWHLVEDNGKKIDTFSLDEKIMKGALVVQISRDGKSWIEDFSRTDVFVDTELPNSPFYTGTDIQLVNGCYYRVIVAYKMEKKLEPKKMLFVNIDEFGYKKNIEVYEFYAYNKNMDLSDANENTKKLSLGSKIRTEEIDGYYGIADIDSKDPHYGWELGEFFVSGYTADTKDDNGNPVFLKNVGDKITLWFNLKQDIYCLNGDDSLSIGEDLSGYDQYFETPVTDFGHGALIIRHIDYENIRHDPQIYTNYLEANVAVGSDTKVKLFEEGDYEVALDYEIKNDRTKVFGRSFRPDTAHYRIFFKFSVRNGNCMVYPFDVLTHSELSNSSITENGFYLDLAKSRYLDLNIKREVLKDGADGLSEDVRFNESAKDKDQFTEEGIYTITVSNRYTGQTTTKKIYVGSNQVLKAYVATGLSIQDIEKQIALGAVVNDDGTLILPQGEEIVLPNNEVDTFAESQEENENNADESEKIQTGNIISTKEKVNIVNLITAFIVVFILIFMTVIIIFMSKKRRGKILKDKGAE